MLLSNFELFLMRGVMFRKLFQYIACQVLLKVAESQFYEDETKIAFF